MTRMARTLAALLFGSTLLMAQLPNPLGLPDPLGLSKKPAPAPSRDGRRVEQRPSRERRDHGKHKGREKHGGREGGDRKGHGKH